MQPEVFLNTPFYVVALYRTAYFFAYGYPYTAPRKVVCQNSNLAVPRLFFYSFLIYPYVIRTFFYLLLAL